MSKLHDDAVLTESGSPPLAERGKRVTVRGPASLSNLGPGFDAVGLCIAGVQDVVEAWYGEGEGRGVEVVQGEGGVQVEVPLDPAKNTAAVAAHAVLERAGVDRPITLRLTKGIGIGSGVGSSAASAVAGAWAANVLLGTPFSKEELVEAVLVGEQVASGSLHGDNVLPALFGGLVLVSSSDPADYRQLALPRTLPVALIQPDLHVFTREARAMLPGDVPLQDAVHTASALARMVDAFHAGDWEAVGQLMMQDRLVEPVRAQLVPCYQGVRQNALEAGALGCALTGSGPAMFAIAETEAAAEPVLEAMLRACRDAGIEVSGLVTSADPKGVCCISGDS